ncbi:MAG: nucleotidyl transferase AbiEii/AbiGii toxin family protein [Planctomycetota bacterium]
MPRGPRAKGWTSRPGQPDSGPSARAIPILDIHELTAGKLAALLARKASGDLFDVHRLLAAERLDPRRLRLGFVLYGAMNRRDWRTVHPEDVSEQVRNSPCQAGTRTVF